jgi:hypothetical protein
MVFYPEKGQKFQRWAAGRQGQKKILPVSLFVRFGKSGGV